MAFERALPLLAFSWMPFDILSRINWKEKQQILTRAKEAKTNAYLINSQMKDYFNVNANIMHHFNTNCIHTGTAVMQVGFKMLASPLVPFLILLEVSIMVSGVE